jgi:NAD(P)-dependent dehydrogenase (short-subunit alcohol dehydrogenase family)
LRVRRIIVIAFFYHYLLFNAIEDNFQRLFSVLFLDWIAPNRARHRITYYRPPIPGLGILGSSFRSSHEFAGKPYNHHMEEQPLKDKVVVVTGSSRGIGRAIAEACAAGGARVVISSRSEEAVRRAVSAMQAKGYSASGIPCDVAKPAQVERLLQYALETWQRIDIWVNNAGLSGGMRPLEEVPSEEISMIIDTNIKGVLEGCRQVMPIFLRQGKGILINISGLGGKLEPAEFSAVYAASKAAVTSLTKSTAREHKMPGISVFAVIPGMVNTDFFREMKVSPRCAERNGGMPYVLDALALPAPFVGRSVAELAVLPPAQTNGRIFSLLRGMRLTKGILKLIRYRRQGKIKG